MFDIMFNKNLTKYLVMNEQEMTIEYFNYIELSDILRRTVTSSFGMDANELFVKNYFAKYGDYSANKKIFLEKVKTLPEIKNNSIIINLKEVNKLFIEYFKNMLCILFSNLDYLCSYSINNPYLFFRHKIKKSEINQFFSIFSLHDFFEKNLLLCDKFIKDEIHTYFNKRDFSYYIKNHLVNLFNRLNHFFRFNYIKKSNIANIYGVNVAKNILDTYIGEVINEVNRINNIYMLYLESEPFPNIIEFENKLSIDEDDLYLEKVKLF